MQHGISANVPDGTGFERGSDSVSSGDVGGEDSRGETVDRAVGLLDDLLLGLERGQDDDGAEDLLLDNLHVGADVSEDGLWGQCTPQWFNSAHSQAR
jgi:hypothetical protein